MLYEFLVVEACLPKDEEKDDLEEDKRVNEAKDHLVHAGLILVVPELLALIADPKDVVEEETALFSIDDSTLSMVVSS